MVNTQQLTLAVTVQQALVLSNSDTSPKYSPWLTIKRSFPPFETLHIPFSIK